MEGTTYVVGDLTVDVTPITIDTTINNTFGIKDWMWEFALDTIQKYNMDNSHGITHFVNTRLYVKIILQEFKAVQIIEGLTKSDEEEILADAGFVHDLIDSKYMNESEALARLVSVFLHNGYNTAHLHILVYIITHMSYSKRVIRQRAGLSMIEHNQFELATKIVVDADQLDAYDPERCRVYQESKFNGVNYKHLSREEIQRLCLGWTKTILVKRVLLYRDVYMNTATGKKLAEPLHNNVIEYVNEHLKNVEMFDY